MPAEASRIAVAARALLLALLPTALVRPVVNGRTCTIARGARIGFSWVAAGHIALGRDARIGHGNLIRVPLLALGERAGVLHLNLIKGPVAVRLADRAAIGNRNHIVRHPRGALWGPASLDLGVWSKITAGHYVDCTRSVTMGDHATLGGSGTQVWTHGFVHAETGLDRYRVDGTITLGDNVYVGSRAMLLAGITVAQGVMIGAGATVAADLLEPGLYVAAGLRRLPRPLDPEARTDLTRVIIDGAADRIYLKS